MNLSCFSLPRLLVLAATCLSAAAVSQAQTILPDATAGQAYSFQLTTNPPQPAGTAYAANGLPTGLAIDASTGVISGTTATVGSFNGDLSLTANAATTIYPFQLTVNPAAGSSTITSAGGAVGTVGAAFSYTLTASNNPTSYNIALLPPGLTASGAVISGTPTQAGLFFTSVSANNAVGQGKILVIMWTINAAGPLPVVTSALVASGQPGTAFSYTIAATNGPTSFAATHLPAGLTINAATGVISGTPSGPGVSTIGLTATNANGTSPSVNLTLTIGNYAVISSATTLTGTVGSPLTYALTATNSAAGYILTGLPAGLSFNTVSGAVSGTPTTAGTYTLSASATNALGTGPVTALTLTVSGGPGNGGNATAPAILVQPISQSATVGSSIQMSVTAVGSGSLSYAWALNGNPISGATSPILTLGSVKATDAGAYMVTVTNAAGSAVSSAAMLTVSSFIVPPAITAQPSNASSSVGTSASFTVGAAGSAPLSYQWKIGGTPIAGATAATLTLPSVTLANAGTYSVVVTNSVGSATSLGADLTVSADAVAPIFQYQPTSTSVNAGGTASFSVGVVGSTPLTYQWYKGSAAIAGATGASLSFPAAQAADAGVYSVKISNSAGTVTSGTATLTVTTGGTPVPVAIIQQPVPVSTNLGGGATFSVAVTGDPTLTYQWRKNQAAIAGATSNRFTLTNVQNSDAATYDVVVANAFSATISFPTPLTVTPVTVPSRLANVSVRGFCGTGSQVLVIGFVIGGSGTESTVVRAVGPTLGQFGITGLMADPQLGLYGAGGSPMGSNDNWGGSATLANAFTSSGAFALPPTSADAAILSNLSAGVYTASVTGVGGTSGVVLLEAYDVDTVAAPTAHFVNVSARGLAGAGSNALTIGFVVSGATSRTFLIRGVGPTLANFGVTGTMATPQLTVYDSTQAVVAANAGWAGTATLTAAFTFVGAFALPPTSADAALLVTLAPGSYTVSVTGASGGSGIALIEMYEMP